MVSHISSTVNSTLIPTTFPSENRSTWGIIAETGFDVHCHSPRHWVVMLLSAVRLRSQCRRLEKLTGGSVNIEIQTAIS